MTDDELTELIGDVDVVVLIAAAPGGEVVRIELDRRALLRPQVTRSILRRQLGHVVEVPIYDDDEHDQLIRELTR